MKKTYKKKNKKNNPYIEALVASDYFVLYIFGDSKLDKDFKKILYKYGLQIDKKYHSPCG